MRLRVDGGLKTGRDVVAAALLGADEVSFGTALLLAEGCLMVRSCHLDTCPVGIATQRPELRAKFAATPEHVEAYLRPPRRGRPAPPRALGFRSFDEAVGHVECLRRRASDSATARRPSIRRRSSAAPARGPRGYTGEPRPTAPGGELGAWIAGAALRALERPEPRRAGRADLEQRPRGRRPARRRDRGLVRRRQPPGRVRVTLTGSAGQSFGAFLSAGVQLDLTGEANDGVGKGMGGGRIVVRPPEGDAGDPTLLGNAALYGATGGELFCAGRAGERFAVRNSGASRSSRASARTAAST